MSDLDSSSEIDSEDERDYGTDVDSDDENDLYFDNSE